MQCPKCGNKSVDLTGEALVHCDVEERVSLITNEPITYWTRWEVMDTADLKEATCHECGYSGEPGEFGL